jgi:hypothetical protein
MYAVLAYGLHDQTQQTAKFAQGVQTQQRPGCSARALARFLPCWGVEGKGDGTPAQGLDIAAPVEDDRRRIVYVLVGAWKGNDYLF